jgi:hypothetical protein
MATNDIFTNIYSKKFMDQESLADHFLDYLHKLIRDSQSTIFASSGFFSPVTLSADTIDSFDVTAFKGQDDVSNILDWLASDNVPFENTNAIVYYVAAGYAELPNAAEINSRTSEVEYRNMVETVGDSADPDSVVDNGPNMTFVVDSVTEAGVSNAGRKVKVWLKDPESAVDWIEEVTVVWSGGQNKITTVGALGQSTISTTAVDYTVLRTGVTVSRGTDLSTIPAYAFIGTVTGAGVGVIPTTFSTAGQIILASDPNVALNLATIFKDVYITPTFPDTGLPKFADPIEFWWAQEHNNSDYTHDDVTFKTLIAKIQAGVQIQLEAFNVGDESAKKLVIKDSGSADVSWLLGDGTVRGVNIIANTLLNVEGDTQLGSDLADTIELLGSIITDAIFDDSTAISPALDFRTNVGNFTSLLVDRDGSDDLRIWRNDAYGTDTVVRLINLGAGGKLGLDVQGLITGLDGIDIGDVGSTPSPVLSFLQSGANPWTIRGNAGVLEASQSDDVADVIFQVLNPGTKDAIIKADKHVIVGIGAQAVLEGLLTLAFQDANTGTPIPFSSVADTALVTTKQNIIGAINEIKTTPLAHTALSDMPSSVVADHDGRYETKADLNNQVSNTKGSALIGHADTDSGMEDKTVKKLLDDYAFMFDVQPKVPIGVYFGASHVVVPSQTVNCKGKIRRQIGADLQLSWSDLDGGVVQSPNKAYYVYLQPDTAPATTYTAKISDVTPVRGFHPTGGKTDWIYVGSFVTDGGSNVRAFTKAGSTVKVNCNGETDRQIASHVAQIINSLKNVNDGTVGVVPETAKFIIIEMVVGVNGLLGFGGDVRGYCGPASPTVNNLHLFTNALVTAQVNLLGGTAFIEGPVGLAPGRQFYFTLLFIQGLALSGKIRSRGWIEDDQFGKFL